MKSPSDSSRLETLVRERIDRWRAGDRPDSAGVLTDHPELLGAKSLVLDLGLAEYSLRTAAGDAVGRGEFCDQFPVYQQSLAKLLEVHEYLDRFPQFAVDEAEVRWPTVGDEFFGYEIVEPLGRGGWARVFLARETAVGRRFVVIKVSRFGSCEAEALGKVSHPSIVPIHSVLHDGGWTVICMPLLGVATAVDLLDAARGGAAKCDGSVIGLVASETRPVETVPLPIPVEQFNWRLPYVDAIARLGLQLAEGLAAAHRAGIFHRDIKPSNILLAWSGRPMLLDFNLATQQGAAGQTVAGTLAYMAPELVESLLSRQAAGGAEERCDVYSLGAVLYQLLTGRLPHQPDGADKLPMDAYGPWLECKKHPAAMVVGEGQMDSRLWAIVLKCLEFAADNRYASAADLAADLQAYLGATATTSRFIMRNRRAVLAGALAVLGSIGLFGAYIGSRPTQFEVLYQRGLGEYDAGDFPSAVATFTKCLELKSGSPEALFGRAQALRRMEKWAEARTDFKALRDADSKWSHALAGYCNMRLGENPAAWSDFEVAHRNGLQDIGFLMNFARTNTKRQRHLDAAELYSEVLSLDSENRSALRNRAMALFAAVRNDKQLLPNAQAFADIEQYRRSEPDGFEPAYCAAILYGESARKGSGDDAKAIAYLTEALQKGMPLELVQPHFIQLKGLLPFVDGQRLLEARRDPDYHTQFAPEHEPPRTARWPALQAISGQKPSLLARSK